MEAQGPGSGVVCFDVFRVDLNTGELFRNDQRLKLQDQPFRILTLLLDRAGYVVSRSELREKLWPSEVFVDFNHGLNSAVARLRETLGDSASNPRFIETIPKHGYRFIALVKKPVVHDPEWTTAQSNLGWPNSSAVFALFAAAWARMEIFLGSILGYGRAAG